MHYHSRRTALFAGVLICLSTTGCSIVSPEPAWELVKAAGGLASLAIAQGPTKASNTTYHLHAPFKNVCIEFNPRTQVSDVVPALQAELREHGIESRVYEGVNATLECPTWLKYTAQLEWGIPPFSGGGYRPYVQMAALTLQTTNGLVLSTSNYQLEDSILGSGKWASTRAKLSPVVSALLTGFQD